MKENSGDKSKRERETEKERERKGKRVKGVWALHPEK